MCRLIAYAAPAPTTLEALIGTAQCNAFRDMSRLHADGWGTAWVEDPNNDAEVHRTRATIPVDRTVPRSNAVESDLATARILHLRMATSGMAVKLENTHPFLTAGLAFAHNGAVVPLDHLKALLDPNLLATVKGGTDSEHYFALIRQHLEGGMTPFEAVCATVTLLRAHFPNASLNALLLSPEELIVIHSSENARIPLKEFHASGLSDAELPQDHLSSYYKMSYLQAPDNSVAFSSTGIDTTGWTPLPPASVASVSLTTMQLKICSLIEAPVESTG
ncbi:MAG: class II glutamine amidotransferase [Candidatus Saccharibacteria bacterium]|nr:class II glutamine amidotransferase [Microbacteriaceae bacterium]